jgi:hypothetical protein
VNGNVTESGYATCLTWCGNDNDNNNGSGCSCGACTRPPCNDEPTHPDAEPQESFSDLWDEYMNGVGGEKPLRLFSEP